MTDDLDTHIRGSRMRLSRSRGAVGGVLLIVLGAWAALIPFIGPSFDFAMTPRPDDSFHWTAARGWLEVLPGAVAVAGGILLLMSAHRLVTSLGGWIAAAGGAWLVVGPALAGPVGLDLGTPDPAAGQNKQALIELLFFFAIGAAILLVAGLALGRLSVHGVRDVRAAERRAAQDAERERAERRAAEERLAQDAERDRAARRAAEERAAAEPNRTETLPREAAAREDTAREDGVREPNEHEHVVHERPVREPAAEGPVQPPAAAPGRYPAGYPAAPPVPQHGAEQPSAPAGPAGQYPAEPLPEQYPGQHNRP